MSFYCCYCAFYADFSLCDFCMNDVFGITKTTSTVTVNLDKSIDNVDDAIDVLSDNGLIKCKISASFSLNTESVISALILKRIL